MITQGVSCGLSVCVRPHLVIDAADFDIEDNFFVHRSGSGMRDHFADLSP